MSEGSRFVPPIDRLARLLAWLALGVLAASTPAGAQPPAQSDLAALLDRARPPRGSDCSGASDALARVLCTGVLRVGVRANLPPFAWTDGDVRRGFEIDLARALAARLGVSASFATVTPANRIAALGEGRVDVSIATMGHTVQRDAEARFVRPHYYQSETLIAGNRAIALRDWTDLPGKTVCVTVGNSTNTELAGRGARLMLYDTAPQLLDQLRLGSCSLVAQDDSFLAARIAAPPFAAGHDVKFGFAPLPWGAAVSRADGARLADALGIAMREMHAGGVLRELAGRHRVNVPFLEEQQALWRTPACANTPADCLLPPRDNRLEPTPFAAAATQAEGWLAAVAGVKVTLAMLKTRVALDLFLSGVIYSLLLVGGAVAATFGAALAFGTGLTSPRRWLRWCCRGVVMTMQSTPIVLLMIFAGVLVSSVGPHTPALAVAAACLVLGLFNGSNAGQAIAEAAASLRADHGGQMQPLSAAVRRARTQIVSFLVNATRGSPIASMMGVPELLTALTDIASFSSERVTTYTLLLVFYMLVVSLVVWLGERWSRRLERSGVARA